MHGYQVLPFCRGLHVAGVECVELLADGFPHRLLVALHFVAAFSQHAHEKSFAARKARHESVDRRIEALKQRSGDVPCCLCLHTDWLCAERLHEEADVLLVLLGVERAGGVNEQTAGQQTFPCFADNVALQSPALFHVLETPFVNGLRVLAEHSLAGTGHVAEHHVEHFARAAVVFGVVAGDNTVRMSPFHDVFC